MQKTTILILTITIFIYLTNAQQVKTHTKTLILQNWKVKINNCPQSSTSVIQDFNLNTSLPTNSHLDLLYNKKIQNPFFSKNWQSQKWISDCNAFYSKNISITQSILSHNVVNLIFEGIDTYSTVKLNSQQILKTQNAFVQYKVNVKDLLKVGQNLLQVQIVPTKRFDQKGQSQNRMPYAYAHTRKPCYQYGWDWAPSMNSLGIWKNVYLEMYDNVSIDFTWIQVQSISQLQAVLSVAIKLKVKEGFTQFDKYFLAIDYQDKRLNKIQVKGAQSYLKITMKQPKLWWPNGFGTPFIYDFKIKLISGIKTIDQKIVPYGVRSTRLDQLNNQFTVILNGYRIYCKGSNYVPMDMLYPRLNNKNYPKPNSIQNLFKDIVKSNFNMIRVWGGGLYETDQFYQMASRMGIMIFHDFMFSDNIYPSTEHFLNNVKTQIVQQIRRIRNYPCLMLWSGNNQILQGIQSWGWGSENYRKDYRILFEQFIPAIIKTQTPYIPYVPTSPLHGVGNGGFKKGGDIHYWGVWAAGLPFEKFQTAIGPFNSQFGTQGLPVWETVLQFTSSSKERSYQSDQMLSHERHKSKFHTLEAYIDMYGKKALNFELQTYQSGLIQAYGIQIALKYQRASKIQNKSMGTLYWQLNDAWPGISWSSIDYFGRWKPLQYKAKQYYQNVIAFYDKTTSKVIAINDNLYGVHCYLQTKIIRFDGIVQKQYIKRFILRQNQAKYILQIQKQQRTKLLQQSASTLIQTKIITGNGQKSITKTFLKPFKQLQLPKCQLKVKYVYQTNFILLKSNCLQKSLHIHHQSKYLSFSDNYIDIVPGQLYRVELLNGNLKQLEKDIKFRTYRQVYQKEQLVVIKVNT